MAQGVDTGPCRLCDNPTEYRFNMTLLGRIDIAYGECLQCRSMQTQPPFWLEEAYADKRNLLDVGRVQRTQLVAMLCSHILGRLGLVGNGLCLDWGGAEGLLSRMMRDRGFLFHTFDIYLKSVYTIPYQIHDPAQIQPIATTAIEVLEHLPDPKMELAAMCATQPRYLIFTTELYSGQGNDWSYLSPINGRHVFFYSTQAMEWIAKEFGYRYFAFPFLHIFASKSIFENPLYAAEQSALELLWTERDQLFVNAATSLKDHMTGDIYKYVAQDFIQLRAEILAANTNTQPIPDVPVLGYIDGFQSMRHTRCKVPFPITGWAFQTNPVGPINNIRIMFNGMELRRLTEFNQRPEVAQLFGRGQLMDVGFEVIVQLPAMEPGDYTLTAIAADHEGVAHPLPPQPIRII